MGQWGDGEMGNSPAPTPLGEWGLGAVGRWGDGEWGECVEALCAASCDDNEGRFNFSYQLVSTRFVSKIERIDTSISILSPM